MIRNGAVTENPLRFYSFHASFRASVKLGSHPQSAARTRGARREGGSCCQLLERALRSFLFGGWFGGWLLTAAAERKAPLGDM
jgi:hypothetical protein